jgi:hypothetical protein
MTYKPSAVFGIQQISRSCKMCNNGGRRVRSQTRMAPGYCREAYARTSGAAPACPKPIGARSELGKRPFLTRGSGSDPRLVPVPGQKVIEPVHRMALG